MFEPGVLISNFGLMRQRWVWTKHHWLRARPKDVIDGWRMLRLAFWTKYMLLRVPSVEQER